MVWKLNHRFTSVKSKFIAAILIIAAFPLGFLAADLVRVHRFRSALDFLAVAVEVDGQRFALEPINIAEIADIHLTYAFYRDKYFTLIGAHDEHVICYYMPFAHGAVISIVPKDLRTNACVGRIARFWPGKIENEKPGPR